MASKRWRGVEHGPDAYKHGCRDLEKGRGAPFGIEYCDVYRNDTCDGYGSDWLCDNCRHITDFVDWWSQEAEAIREFHALVHGNGHISSPE